MDRKHIIRIKTQDLSYEEWVAMRQRGYGQSEIGAVCALAPYQAPIHVHADKIGEPISPFLGNKYTFSGQKMEPLICYWSQFFDKEMDPRDDPTADMFRNIDGPKNKHRSVRRVKETVYNTKYPWLFVHLDREIFRDQDGRGILEAKNTTSMEKRRYKFGVNESFYFQVQGALLIYEVDYADIAIWADGNTMEMVRVYPDKRVQDHILEVSSKSWENVIKAREIKKQFGLDAYMGINPDFIAEDKRKAVYPLTQLEPELTGIEAEHDFIRDLVNPTEEETIMAGKDIHRNWGLQYGIGSQMERRGLP